nr:ribonuclease H-like domain, reverse transcriptase, RNA-dependent DNA polymerase [Tanacetum cinerariifolium]
MMLAKKDSAKEARETLRTMHMGADRVKEAKVQTLRSDFEVIQMKNDRDYSGEKVPSSCSDLFYANLTSIEQFGDLKTMTMEEVVGHLKTHEERLKGYGDQGEPSLLLTHAEWSSQSNRADEKDSSNSSKGRGGTSGRGLGQGRGRGRGRDSNTSRNDQKHFPRDKSKVKCFACEKFGHYASECSDKKKGEEANLTQTIDEEPTLMMAISQEKAPDRGGEFTSKDFASFCEENGVHLRKLDDRAKKMVYFGVEDGTKGNRLYDPQDMKLRVSRDVVVDEKEALDPFSSSSTHTTSPSSEFGPRGFRSLDGIYEDTEIVTLEPEELMMMETDQPTTFKEAVSHSAICLKWVYKVKRDIMGNVVKYKARLVAKGFVKKKRVDFDKVFAPVAGLDTVRLILSIAAQNGWVIHHLDVKSAFLNGDLEEEVYVTQLEGYTNKNESQKDIIEFKEQMKNEFEMSDLGLLAYYLGIEVSQFKWGIALRQTSYAKKIFEQFGLQDCNLVNILMEPKKAGKDEGGVEVDPTEYRRVIGYLRYLTHTRPDLSFAVGIASQEVEHLVGFSDSDHAGDMVGARSTSGMIFYLGRNAITWQSQKQQIVSLSSCESEFIAATAATCQALSKDQRADIFTKALAPARFTEMRNVLGVTQTELGPV